MAALQSLPWPRMASDGVTPLGIDLRVKGEDVRRIVYAKCRWQPEGMTIEDMVQTTLLALFESNRRLSAYDSRNGKLSTYVVMIMQGAFARIQRKKRPDVRLDEEDVHTRRDDRADPRDPISAFDDAEEALGVDVIRAVREGAPMPGAASPAPRSPRPAKRGLVLPNKLYGSSSKRTPEERQQEVEVMLTKYGAKKIQIVRGFSAAVILFQSPASAGGHFVRVEVPLPDADDAMYVGREGLFMRATRQRWAAAALVVKSKLESIVAGIESFESAWLASILLPNGLTVQQWARPQLAASNDSSNDGDSSNDDGVLDAEFDDEDEPCESQALALPARAALAAPRRLPLVPSERLACKPMGISLTAGACMRFQGDAGNRATCGACLVGKDVANRIERAA